MNYTRFGENLFKTEKQEKKTGDVSASNWPIPLQLSELKLATGSGLDGPGAKVPHRAVLVTGVGRNGGGAVRPWAFPSFWRSSCSVEAATACGMGWRRR